MAEDRSYGNVDLQRRAMRPSMDFSVCTTRSTSVFFLQSTDFFVKIGQRQFMLLLNIAKISFEQFDTRSGIHGGNWRDRCSNCGLVSGRY